MSHRASPSSGGSDKCVIDVTLMALSPARRGCLGALGHARGGQADHRQRSEQGAGAARAATQIHGAPGPRSRLWAPTKPPAAPSETSPLRAPAPTCIMILPALPAR